MKLWRIRRKTVGYCIHCCVPLSNQRRSLFNIGYIKQYMKATIRGIGKDKATEVEDGWKAIYVIDLQLYAKMRDLINKQAQAVLDSLELV